MTNLEIKLTDEQFQSALSAALLQSLTPEMRDDLIKQAIAYLTTPRESTSIYGKRTDTPLREAVDVACRQLAHDVAREYIVNSPEVKDVYRAAIAEATAEVLADRPGMRRVLADAMSDAISEGTW